MSSTVRDLFSDHVEAIKAAALIGDDFAIKTLCCLALLVGGFPGGGGDGEVVIDFETWRMKRAA